MTDSRHPTALDGLLAFWDFQEPPGSARLSKGGNPYRLLENNGPVARVEDGVFGPYSACIQYGQWFSLARNRCPALDIHGPGAGITVAAWINRRPKPHGDRECEAVAGMWDETRRKRQYCLFLNLQIWESSQQVGGHVSAIGGPTPGYKYCMDAAIGAAPVPFDQWVSVGMTYDGENARAYLNGRLDVREGRNPYPYPGGLFNAGQDGADFTVGAVSRSGEMGNWFTGLLGGLAIFNRALSDDEMKSL